MNVKPGDLARIVGIVVNNGAIVHVDFACACDGACPTSRGWWRCTPMQSVVALVHPQFPVAAPVPAGSSVCIHDSRLRRLHDGDGQDETLTWAGKPAETWVETLEAARCMP